MSPPGPSRTSPPAFLSEPHDPDDPSPWLALYLDHSTPLPDEVKCAWLSDSCSRSRQFLLPVVRPLARGCVALIQVLKIILPRRFTSSALLHRFLVAGLKRFVRPEANWLILRHFWLGSGILDFIARNSGVQVPLRPLNPATIDDLRDHLFVKHDLNLFNFVINLNRALAAEGRPLTFRDEVDFSGLYACPLRLDDMPARWTNVLDLQTAIELFTPAYQLFLTDNDFWRAANSLQLDETIGVYCATILGMREQLLLVNNKHPLVPLSTLRAGFRLVLHGVATEQLHALLRRAQAQAELRSA
ncbi:MAG: hypothetical protein H7125_10905 [Proteobacteria bacterium]|nr:hypothetical protein [Burkholderiales bacterium]